MAYEIGTASNQADLLNRLVLFLTTNAALVAANQQYTKVFDTGVVVVGGTRSPERGVVLTAPGLAGTDKIYMGIRMYGDVAADHYNLVIMGGTNFNPAVVYTPSLLLQGFGGPSPEVQVLGWNQSTPYWFFANGRRFWMVEKVSTIYETGGAGFILPPCPPLEYPYPLAIHGSMRGGNAVRWSDVSDDHKGPTTALNSSCILMDPGGRWASFMGMFRGSSGAQQQPGYADRRIWPCGANDDLTIDFQGPGSTRFARDTDGVFPLQPVILYTKDSEGDRTMGTFDGLHFVPSQDNGSEDTITVGSDTYICFQTAWRTGNPWLFAIKRA